MGSIATLAAAALLLWLAFGIASLNRNTRALARHIIAFEATLDERLGAVDASIWKIQEGQRDQVSGDS
jgi:hypothetical protein